MKTFSKLVTSLLLLVLSISVCAPSNAQDEKNAQKSFAVAMFPAANACKLWMCLEKYKPEEKISVSLINQKGQVMFWEALPKKSGKQKGFRQQFDMSQLGDGNYTFRISNGTQTEQITFKLSTPTLEEQLPTRLISMN
ncbi:T9SS type A sorting domain-containing protein [Spirosoma taeanense]|uniref:T9SS type A sorting domain-containing protein n=1 Tax=Spirosoma taeanense TaxID=2735870 RepID=A0A6M5Y381_9BACT|nr:T9SS type A sorting domain-containing protein [Spirosoma taeanense]QJW88269.1 T9SS type A sorting domain-containing protein [Spirosoma taeanense]